METANDQGDNIRWINNLFHPTGTAQIITGASTTNFSENEVKSEAPNLVLDTTIVYSGTAGIWKSTQTTPIYTNAIIAEKVNTDIEGQTRPENSNPGADHFSLESVRYKPITSNDVGPFAFEEDDISERLFVISQVLFGNEGGDKDILVTSNLDWIVNTTDSWISVSPVNGIKNETFKISCKANPELNSRTGSVTIKGGELTRTITITQEAAVLTNLINTGASTDPVSVTATTEQLGAN